MTERDRELAWREREQVRERARARRARRARARRVGLATAGVLVVLAAVVFGALRILGDGTATVATPPSGEGGAEPAARATGTATAPVAGGSGGVLEDSGTAPLAGGGTAPSPLAVRIDDPRDTVRVRFKTPPRSGLMFDIDTGRVLWRRDPTRILPIASLTKMMTGLVVTERVPEGSKVRVTKEALAYQGSGVGVLPRGKWIGVNTMLHGLMLPSGNDAAIALAQRAAGGSVGRFVRLMNEKAQAMGLLCTRYSSPSGFVDRGNHSCAADLAAEARAVLRTPRLAKIVRRRQAVLPFPIKGGKLYLYNNNPLLRAGYPGTTGMKTGFTDAAGRCLVATARRGQIRLGVVLLHSPDPGKQATQLLNRGFASAR